MMREIKTTAGYRAGAMHSSALSKDVFCTSETHAGHIGQSTLMLGSVSTYHCIHATVHCVTCTVFL